ncbi:acyl-CoA synthetase [Schlesneria paludicola]|uniref:acyl-CoA synthetase n=1 Tax=Schlesneria paludicola TaxID=360056 RepID=UPI00029A4AEA|nr:acyl-CoA synthetase [Schlesneria paludicola]
MGSVPVLPNPYSIDLDPVAANYAPLTPLSFLARAAAVYPERSAWIHGARRASYAEFATRCRRLASALIQRGIGVGDTVAVMAPNVPPMLEAHYGIPMTGAVLNALNIRLDAAAIAFMLEHGDAKILITDREYSTTIEAALSLLKEKGRELLVIDINDPEYTGAGKSLGELDYEAFLATGDADFAPTAPAHEWDAIALNYTSGTTGNPKAVVYHHRGAYLLAMGNLLAWNMTAAPVYLWTLPMFHCNGWCFPWTLSAVCGTHVCLRKVDSAAIFRAISEHRVTHLCGAPIVLNLLVNAPEKVRFEHTIEIMTAASAPPSSVIAAMEGMGFHVTHVYGLTEVYGPATVCDWHPEWDQLPLEERARLKSRQGVNYAVLEGLMVADPTTMEPCPADGKTLGEVMMRGNIVMKGYLKNRQATEEAFRGGWFHTGDLAVTHPDGYIELKDRSKDIIITGGENVSTIEVEDALYKHPAVMDVAVVARPDEKWGETPCAFICLKPDAQATTSQEIIAFCRQQMAGFKVPKTVVFGPLPRTSTGKIQKHVLRDKARQL